MRGMGKLIIRNLYACIGFGVFFLPQVVGRQKYDFLITVSRVFFSSGRVFKGRVNFQLMVT